MRRTCISPLQGFASFTTLVEGASIAFVPADPPGSWLGSNADSAIDHSRGTPPHHPGPNIGPFLPFFVLSFVLP
jgi:hypothetical protein